MSNARRIIPTHIPKTYGGYITYGMSLCGRIKRSRVPSHMSMAHHLFPILSYFHSEVTEACHTRSISRK